MGIQYHYYHPEENHNIPEEEVVLVYQHNQNLQGFTGLDFYLTNDNVSGGEKSSLTILDVAASIKTFSQTSGLAVTTPDCLLTTSEGVCKI